MDPVPIDHRNPAFRDLVSAANKLATISKNAAGLYSDLASTFTKLSVSCTTFTQAVQAIHSWLTNDSEKHLLDSAPWYQLSTSLARAEEAITVLHDEVQSMLRPRFKSRSGSRVSTDWDLEGLQAYGLDVQHETGTLQQFLQYMKLLEIAGVLPTSQMEPHEVTGELNPHAASLALMPSVTVSPPCEE